MKKEQPKDPHLDTPSVANEDKHINFREEEEKAQNFGAGVDLQNQVDEQRRKEWKEGIDEGKREAEQNRPFEKRDLNEDETY